MFSKEELLQAMVDRLLGSESKPAAAATQQAAPELGGKMCIIRARDAGVWFGEYISHQGREVKAANARRVWSWTGCLSCSELALTGPKSGKISAPVDHVTIMDGCEIIPATDAAITAFGRVASWTN